MKRHGNMRWVVAAVVATALSGCMFGDEPPQAQPIVGPWFDENCVPAECMYECCDGWNYHKDPLLTQGGPECEKVRLKNSAYAEYVALMQQLWNKCSEEFRETESGYCYVINPPDAIKEFTADNQPVYSGLNFLVCPPRGQFTTCPMEDVLLVPAE
ncbi:MAG: hypothetical protein IPM54_20165 [Polyangiaceae bacterium]|nr:hypothetical protein [Polyangiaceae bacterium]